MKTDVFPLPVTPKSKAPAGLFSSILEEISENREQIEISKYYERLPKATLIATQEFEDGKIAYRNMAKNRDSID